MGIPIFWFLDDRPFPDLAVPMFMQRVAELDEWCRRHPEIPSVLTHGLVPATLMQGLGLPDEVVEMLRHPNLFAELLFPAKEPEYPYLPAPTSVDPRSLLNKAPAGAGTCRGSGTWSGRCARWARTS